MSIRGKDYEQKVITSLPRATRRQMCMLALAGYKFECTLSIPHSVMLWGCHIPDGAHAAYGRLALGRFISLEKMIATLVARYGADLGIS